MNNIYKQRDRAFTLVEMVVVVGLAALLLVLVITNGKKQGSVARDRVRVADIQTIRLALEEYKLACREYPARLELDIDNGDCPQGVTLASFLPQIPQAPHYSEIFNYPEQEGEEGIDYFYYGMSNSLGGKCFDYIVGVQLEYGADSGFSGKVNSQYFNEVDQESLAPSLIHEYRFSCAGSQGNGISNADESIYGIYGFRSTNSS